MHETGEHDAFLSPSHPVIVDQIGSSAGSTLELDFHRRASPARAVARTPSRRLRANAQAQLSIVALEASCWLTHLHANAAKSALKNLLVCIISLGLGV